MKLISGPSHFDQGFRISCLPLAIRLSSPASGAADCTQHDGGVKPFESNPPHLWQGSPVTTDHTFLQTQPVVHDHVFLPRAHQSVSSGRSQAGASPKSAPRRPYEGPVPPVASYPDVHSFPACHCIEFHTGQHFRVLLQKYGTSTPTILATSSATTSASIWSVYG